MNAWIAVVLAVVHGPRGIDPAAQPAVLADEQTAPVEPVETPAAPMATTTQATPAPARQTAKPPPRWSRPKHPRLVLGVGPILGPHTFGNEECRADERSCEVAGTFLGVGAQTELRVRLWRPLYAHARVLAVANAAQREPVHAGAWGLGLGVGLYARYAFGRVEYVFLDAFGDDRFRPPYFDGQVARDAWQRHAGLFSVGARLPFHARLGAELWGGFMLGPRSSREIPGESPERRLLTTFIIGMNMTFDLVR